MSPFAEFTEFLGLLAGTLTTCAFIPQVLKVWKMRSAKDISIAMYIIYCSGLIIWAVYGVLIDSLPIILSNGVTACLALAILTMKILFK